MSQNVTVGIMTAATDTSAWQSASWQERCGYFRHLVAGLNNERTPDGARLSARAAVPENYFARGGTAGYVNPRHTYEQKRSIFRQLALISAQPANQGILMFPGTINYKKELKQGAQVRCIRGRRLGTKLSYGTVTSAKNGPR